MQVAQCPENQNRSYAVSSDTRAHYERELLQLVDRPSSLPVHDLADYADYMCKKGMAVPTGLKSQQWKGQGFTVFDHLEYGWIGQQSSSGFINLAPSILHYNWF